jgi:hypothetical protein
MVRRGLHRLLTQDIQPSSTGSQVVLADRRIALTFSAEEVGMMIIRDSGSTERTAGNEPAAQDPALSPLSLTEATHLVRLARAALSERGFESTYDGAGALVTGSGLVAGLTNLARTVAGHRRHRWPQLVATHFDQLATSLRHGPPAPPVDPVSELYLRLVPAASLPPDWSATAPEFVPGLLTVPATQANGMVAMHLRPEDFGMSRAEATEAGLANLRRLSDKVEYAEHNGARVALLSGSTFTASRALVLHTVLRESLHVENPKHGLLVSMPVRDLLLVHVITDDSVISALSLMLTATHRAYAEEPGPLSPWVYLVTDDGWHPATEQADDHFQIRLSSRMLAHAHRLDPRW